MMLHEDRRQYIRYGPEQRHSLMVREQVVPLVNSVFTDATDVNAMDGASLLIPLIYS